MTPRGPSYHPFVPGFGLEVLPFRGDSQFGNPAGVKGCCFGFLLFDSFCFSEKYDFMEILYF